MKLPNWFKIAWWVLLIGVLTRFLHYRLPHLLAGEAVPADIVVFVIWIALLLAPLFNEVSLLGITLKQEVEELKKSVSLQISEIRNEVRNSSESRASVNQQFTMPMPVPDAQLPEMEAKIRKVLSEELKSHGFRPKASVEQEISTPDDVSFLFSVRYNIEKELRRIAEGRPRPVLSNVGLYERRPLSVGQLTRELGSADKITPEFAHVIREVYAVCSPAIHGEEVSDAQVRFVKDVAPDLVNTLKAMG